MNYIHSNNNLTVAMCLVSIQTRTYTHTHIVKEEKYREYVVEGEEKEEENEERRVGMKKKKFFALPSPMNTRCQYVERDRGNLSTHADQYHSSIVIVALLSLFFNMCH